MVVHLTESEEKNEILDKMQFAFSADQEGTQLYGVCTGEDLVKDMAFMQILSGKAYVHAVDYPMSYSVNLSDETWNPKPFMRSEHKIKQLIQDDNYAEFSNDLIVRLSTSNDYRISKTHPYLDHLKFG